MTRTEALLAEIDRKGSTRDSIAAVYADGIRAHLAAQKVTDQVNWAVVNKALLDRYEVSGLNYIKAKAWKPRAGTVHELSRSR